ncbi:hypothetical protein BRADI_3g36437v3 [Brachypodium distachyon]|uniref:Uncharacterized protein n=2 Tax=Brachypodium distachyon TaxID=15368 RepID=A0A0Q3ID53_BRADI|nr:hypothetical protein BRADI_3g36437v3 [Brachypodium distachyon]PNT68129.1 hypothetical protein BRADI_3g36437v3 [Brachypodium distachyon]PNT68130.1 hypothetical protein BRADI_3g36437v3 [Brachypodium distachyon]
MRKAGAKEDIEGSIGFERAVDVNPSLVSAETEGRLSDLMIRLCSCSGRSSALRTLSKTYISMTCKGCGGESIVDRGGPSCSIKLNTMGLELPRPIDPEVNWNTVNRRQRAPRRARTTFSGEDRMTDEIKSFYGCVDAPSREMAREDAPVSDSEKLGVSILGRRFSDSMENVPIKKRKFHMDCSPSPPPTPLLVDPYEKIPSRSCGGTSSYGKHRKVKMLGGKQMEEKKGPFDTADFSGISILAAVACESELDGAILNGECSKSAHSLEERKPENIIGSSRLGLLHEIKEDKLNIADASHCKVGRPLISSETAPDMKPLFPSTLNSSESAPDMKPTLFPTTLNSLENDAESAAALKANTTPNSSLKNADKTDDASDKSADVIMSNNSSNPDKFVGCFGDTVMHTKHSDGTHDSRLHWDLNVPMEVWDTHCGGDDHLSMVGSAPVTSDVRECNDAEKDMNNPQDLCDPIVAGDILHLSGDKIHVVEVPKDVKTKDQSGFPADGSFHPLCSQSPQHLQLLDSESLNGNGSSVETNDLPDQQKSSYVSKMELHIGSNPDLIKEPLSLTADVEKLDVNLDVSHATSLDRKGLPHLVSADGHGGGSLIQTGDLGSRVKPPASRIVSEESTNIATVTVSNKSFTDAGWSDDKLGQVSLQSIAEYKNEELLDVDSGTSKTDLSVNDKAEHSADLLCVANRAPDADNDLNLPDHHPENNLGTSDCNMANVHEEDGVDPPINCKNHLVTCANSSSAEPNYITSDAPQALDLSSECTKLAVTDVDSTVDSRSAAQSYPDGYKNGLQKVSSSNRLEQCYQTDTSHVSKNLSVTGKVDVEEDDSQYEDGELRESGDRYWADDGSEEVKCADYQVSDYKDEEATPDIHPVPAGSVLKNLGIPTADYDGTLSRKEDRDVSPVSSKRSRSSNCLDGGSGIICAASIGEEARDVHLTMKSEAQMYESNPGHVIAESAATVSQSERCSDGLGDDPLNIRTKPTGWDMLPEDQEHSHHDSRDGVDSSNQCVLGTLDPAEGGESFRRMGLSKRDVQSQLDRPRSFDRSHRNEHCRSDDGYGSGSKAERTIDAHRSHGRGGASRHGQTSSQVEQWVENSNNSRSTQRGSPDYYNYGPPGPRNAAEAAVAKMESNGFVVAPDGTLVRAVDAANAGTMARRMKSSSSSYLPLSGRGSPIDRDGGCVLSRGSAHAREAPSDRRFGASGNRSGRFGPEVGKDDTADGNISSVRCSLSNRQQRRFPPHRASLKLSRAHSQSPSGSRSRSPHAWTSPRNRRDIMENGGSSIRRHSRSPNYMTEVRIGRVTSPRRQPGFGDRVMRDSSSSRNRTYTQHDSTWVDGRNYQTADISDNKKRYSRRSPPPRITSRNDRFDVMDSQGRSRSGEFHCPTHERLPYSFERGNKHDGNGDNKREYDNRYETVKPYDRNGTVKHFRNHTGDKLHPRISAPRSPGPQRRGSPRRF